jgi:hypothetical protein
MSVNATLAAVPAILGTVLGGGLAYIFFKYSIQEHFGEAKKYSTHAKIKYWCGVLAFIAIAQGFMSIFNELLFVLMNESRVKEDNIFKAIVTIIAFPVIMFIVQFVLSLTFKNSDTSTQVIVDSTDSNELNNAKTSSAASQSEIRKTILLIGGLIIAAVLVFRISPSSFSFAGNGEFTLSECESCAMGVCSPITNFTSFKVLDSSVQIYFKDSNGMDKIMSLPRASDEKCVIAKSKNFAFDCNSSDFSLYTSSSWSAIFNGTDKFVWSSYLASNKKVIADNKMICRVN